MRCLMKGVEDLSKAYVAQPKDNTLPSLLHEAFILPDPNHTFGTRIDQQQRQHVDSSRAV